VLFSKIDRPEPPRGPKAIKAATHDGVLMRHPLHNLTADVDPDPENVANAESQGWERVQ
jgi:hypothetical protein